MNANPTALVVVAHHRRDSLTVHIAGQVTARLKESGYAVDVLDLEADRIQNLNFDPKMIESERGVVASERRTSVDNNNFGLLDEQLWATSYIAHPYQWPVVGWMADIENWKLEDLKRHFEMGYSPSNATMVVSGDVRAEEIFKLAEKYIEPIPAHAPPPPVTTSEPEQLGERRATVKKFAQLPLLMVSYHIPQSANPDYYALRVLREILFSGQSSRMYQRIVDKDQVGLFVDARMNYSLDPTLFVITAQPKDDIKPETIERAIYVEIDRIKSQPITDEELEKARQEIFSFAIISCEVPPEWWSKFEGLYQTVLKDMGRPVEKLPKCEPTPVVAQGNSAETSEEPVIDGPPRPPEPPVRESRGPSTGLVILLVLVAIVLVTWVVGIFNQLVTLKNRYKNAFAQIEVQLKRRYDLIPNLVEVAKGYMKHERETLEAVIQARNRAAGGLQRAAADPGDAKAIQGLAAAEGALTGTIGRLFALAEAYPDLKANQNMMQVSEELTSTENKVAFARQAFNDAVTAYNTYRQSFPPVVFAGMFGHGQDAALLEFADRAAIQEAPKVSFR